MTIPQLRIRTEYSFRTVYGKLPDVVSRLQELGTPLAAIVDEAGSTWGHYKWEQACHKAGIIPAFGLETRVVWDLETPNAPRMFALATDTTALYRLSSASARNNGRLHINEANVENVIWFSGENLDADMLTELSAWVTVDPSSPLLAVRALKLAERMNSIPLPICDNYYPRIEDRALFQMIDRPQEKPTPQHILSEQELRATIPWLKDPQFSYSIKALHLLTERLRDVKLHRAPLISAEGDIEKLAREGIPTRMPQGWPQEYEQRLQRELGIIREKRFESYFLVVADMVRYAKAHMLVGPARGSAAGSLVCWLLGITEIDPLRFGLIFERFIDVTRADLPDIDLDFNDMKRHLVYEYLERKYGRSHVARIGTVSELKPKSILTLVGKKLNVPAYATAAVRNAMFVRSTGDSRANNCLEDTLRETLPGRDLLAKHPAFGKVGALEGHASHTGIHAAGYVVCNAPVENFCTVNAEGVISLDKYDAEALGLLKIDALGLRTLGILEDAACLTPQQFYDLPLDDPATFQVLNERKYAGVFQWEGGALQSVTSQLQVSRFEDLAHITALARPGPLGSGAASKFINRFNGEPVQLRHALLEPYLRPTYGLFLYQEQVLEIGRNIGHMSWEDVTALRKAMSKSLGKEYFDKFGEKFRAGAAQEGIPAPVAQGIWDEMNTFGAWAFNKSHSVSYALVSYWTAYMKAHYPLEYTAAALRNAKDDDSTLSILREFVKEGGAYIPFDPARSEVNWSVKDNQLLGGFLGIKGIGPAKAEELIQARANGGFTDKQRETLENAELTFCDLFPAHTLFGDYYTDSEAKGIRGQVLEIGSIPEQGNVVVIGLLMEKDQRDENETIRLARRKGKKLKGPSVFLDLVLRDDSSKSITLRIDRFDFERIGRPILEFAVEERDWFLVRGFKIGGYNMIKVEKIKCLTKPELFAPKTHSGSGHDEASSPRAAGT